MFDIRDKERSLGQRPDKDALGWATEVMINRNDMDDMRQACYDLENKVNGFYNLFHSITIGPTRVW